MVGSQDDVYFYNCRLADVVLIQFCVVIFFFLIFFFQSNRVISYFVRWVNFWGICRNVKDVMFSSRFILLLVIEVSFRGCAGKDICLRMLGGRVFL
jgi:hypothetical protein